MAATINTNTYSLLAQRNLAQNSNGLQSAINRLSSGLRVNSARDDASGLARGMSIDAASRVTSVQIRIAQDAISSDETKDGNLGVLNDVLQRMTELAADTANSTAYTAEMSALATRASALATAGGATITVTATDAASTLQSTIQTVATARATLGANMNDNQFAIQTLQVQYANQRASYGRIMDADYAQETSNMTRFQILQQAGTAMVSQANAIPQNVLTLLR